VCERGVQVGEKEQQQSRDQLGQPEFQLLFSLPRTLEEDALLRVVFPNLVRRIRPGQVGGLRGLQEAGTLGVHRAELRRVESGQLAVQGVQVSGGPAPQTSAQEGARTRARRHRLLPRPQLHHSLPLRLQIQVGLLAALLTGVRQLQLGGPPEGQRQCPLQRPLPHDPDSL